jgi:predicted nucleotidyltransferase
MSVWDKIRDRRAAEHRAVCVAAANDSIRSLANRGVRALIFGSLTKKDASFREDSDIDICIMDTGGMTFADIENEVRSRAGKNVNLDLCLFENVKENVRQSVMNEGVDYVK